MTGPEVAAAAERLAAEGLLAPEAAERLGRVARRELVSLRGPLRFLLTSGILLVATGAGLLVKENADRLGPLVIGGGLGLAAAAALAFAFRGAPPFTWEEAPERGALCQAMLLLGALLLGTDLAFLETQLRLLGASWPYHLLVLAFLYGALAYRHDSKALLSMALTSFAAWRGLSRDLPLDAVLGRAGDFRANALFCAALFAAGAWLSGTGRKKHFLPIWSNAAILLLLTALGSGALTSRGTWPAWTFLFVGTGAAIAFAARKRCRPAWFAQGAVAVWLGACRVLFELRPESFAALAAGLFSLAFFVFLVREMRSLKDPR